MERWNRGRSESSLVWKRQFYKDLYLGSANKRRPHILVPPSASWEPIEFNRPSIDLRRAKRLPCIGQHFLQVRVNNSYPLRHAT